MMAEESDSTTKAMAGFGSKPVAPMPPLVKKDEANRRTKKEKPILIATQRPNRWETKPPKLSVQCEAEQSCWVNGRKGFWSNASDTSYCIVYVKDVEYGGMSCQEFATMGG
ncbi:hypothetical protein FEM48_Zijuj09G0180400 [Ziziphus jujuba var. spinosa]|uniref:Uncharacterized protein n=1 Tax=Ziziphus jujuba var. spinosa TaxID=714518 RepID=A0A978UUH0_ZIZJJ|nr:hypothetical protein FEM48_Zijuj09G0180400 [Ziziphus jujuba var. spinosa]